MDANPANPSDPRPLDERLHDELIDTVDEELEMEIDDSRLASLVEHTEHTPAHPTVDRHTYFKELLRLQKELVKLQDWVVYKKLKLMVLFEGRDAAGKGGSHQADHAAAQSAYLQSRGVIGADRA